MNMLNICQGCQLLYIIIHIEILPSCFCPAGFHVRCFWFHHLSWGEVMQELLVLNDLKVSEGQRHALVPWWDTERATPTKFHTFYLWVLKWNLPLSRMEYEIWNEMWNVPLLFCCIANHCRYSNCRSHYMLKIPENFRCLCLCLCLCRFHYMLKNTGKLQMSLWRWWKIN